MSQDIERANTVAAGPTDDQISPVVRTKPEKNQRRRAEGPKRRPKKDSDENERDRRGDQVLIEAPENQEEARDEADNERGQEAADKNEVEQQGREPDQQGIDVKA